MEKKEFSKLFAAASQVCRQAHYPVNDSEYQSAINFAIAKAFNTHNTERGRSLSSWCCILAIQECRRVSLMFSDWKLQDATGAGRGACSAPVSTPIRLSAFEVLSFVARHGRTRSARMLRLTVPKINELLHDVAREIDDARQEFVS